MPRSVLLDPGLALSELSGCGVLVGSYLPSQLLVTYVAPTPSDEEGDQTTTTAAADLDVPWLLEHARQVLRLLPGGVQVVGFASNSPSSLLSNAEGKIKKLLTGLRELEGGSAELVFLVAEGVKARALVGDDLNTVEIKVADQSIEYVQLDTTVILDIPVAIRCGENTSKMLFTHAESGVRKFERTLDTAICLFDSALRSPSDLITPPQFEAKKRGRGRGREEAEEGEGEQVAFNVTVLVKDDPNVADSVSIEDNNIRIKLAGKLKSRAYVPHGTTIAASQAAITTDIMRSLRGRIQLHCDSLVGEEGAEGEVAAGPIVHEPPRRVFIRLPGTQVCVSDYLYPGEGGEDSIESIKEIFGFVTSEEHIEDDMELVAAAKDVKRDVTIPSAEPPRVRAGLLYAIASLAVAALSAGVAWWRYAGNTEDDGQHVEL